MSLQWIDWRYLGPRPKGPCAKKTISCNFTADISGFPNDLRTHLVNIGQSGGVNKLINLSSNS